ncbi:hypothetical protein [Streptomyces sp. NPDC056785]|uniref:hypothetical protein n=1 Tax=Streptomyces sp. NPDC056785 TaxID=3345944 RepID=UPI0036A355D7
MGLRDFARSLRPGNDRALAEQYDDRESASDRAARQRREQHRARVARDGDQSGTRVPRRYRKHNG